MAKAAPNHRPTVAIFRAPIFNPSETFIQAQAAALTRYRPVITGLEHKGHVRPGLDLVLAASQSERLRFLAGSVAPMAARLRPHAPALVHAHFGTDGVAALPLARALGVPLVTTLHGHDVSRPPARLLLSGRLSWMRYALLRRRLWRDGALFLAVSEAVRERAIAIGFPAERTIVHRTGVDLAAFRPAPERVEPGLILHVGRLVAKKGTADLLQAFARLGSEARLVIAGDGPLRASLERQADNRVRFLGAVPAAEIADWMQRAWLIAAPSVTAEGDAEGLPTVLVEAAASGLPSVATNHAGIPEVVRDGSTGLLVPEHYVAALADRIGAFLMSPERRADFSRAARLHAEQEFDLAVQTRLLEGHYDRLLSRLA